jgi:hypothetical protein
MFDDEQQQKRYEEFQQRRARYLGKDVSQEMPEIIYKRYDPPAPQESTSMDSETQAMWDHWCDTRIERRIETLAEVVGSETARNEKKLEQRLLVKIDSLQDELTKIRSMVEGNVTPIDRARKDGTNG